MPPHLHLDFETFSEADLPSVGAYRYAFDPSTEILCAAMALGGGEPVVWCDWERFPIYNGFQQDWSQYDPYWDTLEDPNTLIYCHNAQFEMAICQALLWKTWGIKCPDLRRFRCTASLARRACLPASLEKLGNVLNLESKKDNKGKALIKKFSMLQPAKKPTKARPQGMPVHRIRPEDDPQAFAEFMAYCAQDVRVEQQVAKLLAYFDEPINNDNYTLTEIINARGVTVNLEALRHAQRLVDEETEIVSAAFRELTGFEVTQNAKLLQWVNAHGHNFENLQAETVDTFLEQYEDIPTAIAMDVIKALRMKQSIAYAAIKKIPTMLACAGPHDNRIRGLKNHHGATTGRWSDSLVQFGNMKRPTIDCSEAAYNDICRGISREMLEISYGPVLEVISSCIRHFVHDCS